MVGRNRRPRFGRAARDRHRESFRPFNFRKAVFLGLQFCQMLGLIHLNNRNRANKGGIFSA